MSSNTLEIKQKGAKSARQDKKRKRSDDVDDDDDDDVDNICSDKWNSNGEEGENDEDSGNASLFESVVALLCQALHVDKASVIAMDAVNSLENLKGNFSFNHTVDSVHIPNPYAYMNLFNAFRIIALRCRESEVK